MSQELLITAFAIGGVLLIIILGYFNDREGHGG